MIQMFDAIIRERQLQKMTITKPASYKQVIYA